MKKSRRRLWIWLTVTGGLALLVVIATIVAKNMIEKKFNATITQLQPYLNIKYEGLHINLLSGSFSIDSLQAKYTPDQSKQEQAHEAGMSSISLSGINYFKLISGKTFSASELSFANVSVLLNSALLEKKDTIAKTLLSKIDVPFETVKLGKIQLANADISKTSKSKNVSLANTSFTINNVQLGKANNQLSMDSIHFSDISCSVKNINYSLPGYHSLHINEFNLNSKDSTLQIDSIKLRPELDKYELGKKLERQADCITASVPSLTLTGLDVKQLMQKKLRANEMKIENGVIYVFRDRRLPREMKEQPRSVDYLKQIPFDVYIKNFKLSNTNVTSEEFPKDGEKTGYIKIADVSIGMKPFFNKSQKDDDILTAHVKGNIMSAGIIQAKINMSLKTGNEQINGSIEELHLPALNPSAENLGKFHVESGVLNHLDFDFTADSKKATGKIVGEYHDLVVQKLRETKEGKLKKAGLPSLALKAFIIPKNKDASMPIERRTGKIDFDRDPTRLVTFFYIKSLLDGIRDSFSLGFLLPK